MFTEGLQWKADLRRAAWAAEADNYEIVDLCSETTELDFSTQHDSEVGEDKENAEPNLQDEKKAIQLPHYKQSVSICIIQT